MFREGVQDNKQKICYNYISTEIKHFKEDFEKILLPSHKTILNWIFKGNECLLISTSYKCISILHY